MIHACPSHAPGVHTCYNNCRCRCAACCQTGSRYSKRQHHGERRLVSAVGTHRRLQALMFNGWPSAWLSAELGSSPTYVGKLLERDKIQRRTAEAVGALFERLWDQRPDESTPTRANRVKRARELAAARGWAPPMAWDDIDDPRRSPQGVPSARKPGYCIHGHAHAEFGVDRQGRCKACRRANYLATRPTRGRA